jgi:triacylglycerol lipase
MLLWELNPERNDRKSIPVDGGAPVKAGDLLRYIHRVVFLSVPHWGTNIADWVQAEWIWRKALIEERRALFAGSQIVIADRVESVLSAQSGSITGKGFFRAVQDALDEANEHNGKHTDYRKAEAHEAASELGLYLRHMASDFRAIDDLTSRPPWQSETKRRKPMSPAHFNAEEREKEQEQLRKIDHIEFRTYVTIGKRPFRFAAGIPAPAWELMKPWTAPEMSKDSALSAGTDCMYRTCYRACAGGPFDPPKWNKEEGKRLSSQQPIEIWDNDGIVNTLSMFWPLGENVLVHADHMDIVGHYAPILADPGSGRKYRAYDLLKSDSGFDHAKFHNIWSEIFAFALGRPHARRALAARAA